MLRRKTSKYLGVLFALEHASGTAIVEHMRVAAAARGYGLALAARSSTRDDHLAVDELIGYRCEALILISPSMTPARLRHLAKQLPVVAIGHGTPRGGYDVVRSAGDVGIGQAVDHLVGLGHREIAFAHAQDMPGGEVRHRGYLGAMARHGLPADVVAVRGEYTEEAGTLAARSVLARPALPTAVIASNDHAAAALVTTLARAGVDVPGDVSITGYDDTRTARLPCYDLTSVRQDPAEMGQLAVESALARVTGERTRAREFVTATALVVRSSTAAPRTG
jgi:DNA-binding LacI/PurR family transcriptional regulator